MYLSYGISRAIGSLWKNWRFSFSNTLIVGASLSVVAMIALLYLNIVHISEIWLSNTTVSLFLDPDLGQEDRQVLFEKVRQNPMVTKTVVISPEEGLTFLSSKLRVNREYLTGMEKDGLPYTIDFDVHLDYRERVAVIAEDFRKMSGVEDVVYAERGFKKVRLFFTYTKGIGLSFIALFLTAFCLIISHATRLSIHSRRQEIEILHLLGATQRFIRSAFVVEGMLIALGGALIALSFTWITYRVLVAGLTWDELTRSLKAETIFFDINMLGGALVVIVLLGGFSSHLSVNRMLRNLEP